MEPRRLLAHDKHVRQTSYRNQDHSDQQGVYKAVNDKAVLYQQTHGQTPIPPGADETSATGGRAGGRARHPPEKCKEYST
jgi:hypothetical protein